MSNATQKRAKRTAPSSPTKEPMHSENAAPSEADPGRFELIPVVLIAESPTNPRKTFKGLDDLAETIRQYGVIEPVLVRPKVGKLKDFELVCGARRLRASKAAGRSEIPAMIRDMTDMDVLEVQTIENDQRDDVHPLEQADGYQRLMEMGHDVASLAAKTGRSETFIRQRLALGNLQDPWREAFFNEKFPFSHAAIIARLTTADQAKLAKDYAGKDILNGEAGTINRLKWAIREFLLELSAAPFPLDDTDLYITTACTDCPKRTGFAPGLWSDIDDNSTQGDRCTDGVCFQRKTDAYLDRQARKLDAKGEQYVEVSTSWRTDKPRVLPRDRYEEITAKDAKGDPNARKALVVDGQGVGKVIHVRVKPEPETKTDRKDDWKKKQAAQERKHAVQVTVNTDVFLRVATKIVEPSRADLLALAEYVWEDMGSEGIAAFHALHGLPQPDPHKWTQSPLGEMAETNTGLLRLLAQLLLAQNVCRTHKGMPEPLKAAADREGLSPADLAEITKAAKKAVAQQAKGAKAKPAKGSRKAAAEPEPEYIDDDDVL